MTAQEQEFAKQLNANKVVMHDETWAAVHVGEHCYGYEICGGEISRLPVSQYW